MWTYIFNARNLMFKIEYIFLFEINLSKKCNVL